MLVALSYQHFVIKPYVSLVRSFVNQRRWWKSLIMTSTLRQLPLYSQKFLNSSPFLIYHSKKIYRNTWILWQGFRTTLFDTLNFWRHSWDCNLNCIIRCSITHACKSSNQNVISKWYEVAGDHKLLNRRSENSEECFLKKSWKLAKMMYRICKKNNKGTKNWFLNPLNPPNKLKSKEPISTSNKTNYSYEKTKYQ